MIRLLFLCTCVILANTEDGNLLNLTKELLLKVANLEEKLQKTNTKVEQLKGELRKFVCYGVNNNTCTCVSNHAASHTFRKSQRFCLTIKYHFY